MVIFECKPGNLPEHILPDFDETYPFIIGSNVEIVNQEYNKFCCHIFSWRKLTNKGYSWCGEHPRYWREMTENEKKVYVKFMNHLKKLFNKK